MKFLTTALHDIEVALGIFDALHTAGVINLKAAPTIDAVGNIVTKILSDVVTAIPVAPPAAPAA